MNVATAALDSIHTARLELIPNSAELVRAFSCGRKELENLIQARVPDEWPLYPEIFLYVPEKGIEPRFRYYVVVSAEDHSVVGEMGYKGDPTEPDGVRMAYAILPRFRQRGFATEGLQALLKHAFTDPDLNKVYVGPLGTAHNAEHIMDEFGFQVVERYDNDHWWRLLRKREAITARYEP